MIMAGKMMCDELITDGLIQRIVLSDYVSGTTVPSRIGLNGTSNVSLTKNSDGSVSCNSTQAFSLGNSLNGKTIEIIAKSSNITNTAYFTLDSIGSTATDYTIVRTSNSLQYYPPLTNILNPAIWSSIHSLSCFLNITFTSTKVYQNAVFLKSGATSAMNHNFNIFIGTRNIATNNMYVYEVRLYNRELTQLELDNNYQFDSKNYGI